jgi:hypothetical protein
MDKRTMRIRELKSKLEMARDFVQKVLTIVLQLRDDI